MIGIVIWKHKFGICVNAISGLRFRLLSLMVLIMNGMLGGWNGHLVVL